jgi:hypothetical protein
MAEGIQRDACYGAAQEDSLDYISTHDVDRKNTRQYIISRIFS